MIILTPTLPIPNLLIVQLRHFQSFSALSLLVCLILFRGLGVITIDSRDRGATYDSEEMVPGGASEKKLAN